MLIVGYKQIKSKEQNIVPPVFIKINKAILISTIQELISLIYKQFKPYLSPFITASNLQLQQKSGKSLAHKLPLFMYMDYKRSEQYFNCQITSLENINKNNNRYDNLYCNAILRKIPIKKPEKQLQITILSKFKDTDIKKFNQLIENGDRVYICGRQIKNTANKVWSDIIKQNWQRLQNIRDKCLYIFIDGS